MKILCIGDIHIKQDNIVQIDIFLKELQNHLKDTKYDIIIQLGDLMNYHNVIYTSCLNKAVKFLQLISKYCEQCFVLVGNHDFINNSQFLTHNHSLNCLFIEHIKIIDTPFIKDDLCFCPYCPDGRFREMVDTLDQEKFKKCKYIFAHQLFSGISFNSVITDVEEWKGEQIVISGHIHQKQKLKNIIYSGSSIQVNSDELPDKSLLVLETYDSKSDFSEVFLNIPKKITINSNCKELKFDDFKFDDPMLSYRIVVTGSFEEFKNFKKTQHYKQLLKNKVRIVFKNQMLVDKYEPQNKNTFFPFKDVLIDIIKNDKKQMNIYTQLVK